MSPETVATTTVWQDYLLPPGIAFLVPGSGTDFWTDGRFIEKNFLLLLGTDPIYDFLVPFEIINYIGNLTPFFF